MQSLESSSRTNGVGAVVGYDGSAAGRRIVAQATRRLRTGDRLIIVRSLGRGSGDSTSLRARYGQTVSQMLSALGPSILGGRTYELRVVTEPLAEALSETARRCRAAAIVLGTAAAAQGSDPDGNSTDPVDCAGQDSFPASDPPSSWAGPALRPAGP
jgi:hypothetical protein